MNSENSSKNDPTSLVCKLSGNKKRKTGFIWRFAFFLYQGNWEDHFNRNETAFYQQVAPHLAGTSFMFPKIFFAGTDPVA